MRNRDRTRTRIRTATAPAPRLQTATAPTEGDREKRTPTRISSVGLRLPAPESVLADALHFETKARAEELDEKIETTRELIDQMVYELCGLTDEEIEIAENAVEG
ncbi:hypothetical protein NGM10_05305 [Halorussus salilacus]|uniref:hypothetical protein n=1 Tax=Halorussus salilacus TaxID=2953750 RepID=UPI00209F4A7A|nr:hypothetical protein [Halorussus salilacus]USZ69156.1 hypothetical protein NGM10_05305 [Halorussus salilacus]